MRGIRDIKVLENAPVLVRAALNVPVAMGKVTNEYRLHRALPTIRFLQERGACVILISHIGELGTETLAPVADALKRLLPNVSFCGETVGENARSAARTLLPGQILVLENLRRYAGEKNNNRTFARELSSLGDLFVQDCFDTCHRVHASIVGVPKFLPSYAGLLLEEEVRELTDALSPKHPALAVIGGAKFSTKEPVISSLLTQYDHVFVGGALANDFLRVLGREVGRSLTSNTDETTLKKILANKKLLLPTDSIIRDGMIVDAGEETIALLTNLAGKAKTIIWNGPLGNYENGFIEATESFARTVATSRAHSIIGGGDTITAIEHLGILPKFSFVSTGGGAMLEFLARGTLPGIEALR